MVSGRIVRVVNCSGTVKPVLSVRVGAVVSGPVVGLFKDFNEEVKKGDLLAEIDPRLYQAAVDRDEANLESRKADILRVQAQLGQATNDNRRALELFKENPDFVSQAELDQLRFSVASLEAQLKLAQAAVAQAKASLTNSQINLDYTKISSPVDGVIIDRKIDEGQSLASQFQTPELFIVAPDLREKVHIYATVDETEIGLIQEAQKKGRPVEFTVDAYLDDLFTGAIDEIRLSSTEVQNVVTYPVVIAAPNPDLKLLPGMTANISVKVDERDRVVKIPNAALRDYPDEKHVHPDDRKLLKGETWESKDSDDPEVILSAEEKAEVRRKRNRRHVRRVEGEFLRAVEVVIGLVDSKHSELVSGNLKEGDQLVTGIEANK